MKTINWPDWASFATRAFGLKGRVSLDLDEVAVPTFPIISEHAPYNVNPVMCGRWQNEALHALNLSPVGVRPQTGGILVVKQLIFAGSVDLNIIVGLVTPAQVSTNVTLTAVDQLFRLESPLFVSAGVVGIPFVAHQIWRGDAAPGLVVSNILRVNIKAASPSFTIDLPGKGIVLDGTDPAGIMHLVTFPTAVATAHPGVGFVCESWPAPR